MAQPPGYTPTTDFSQDEASNVAGRSTVRTANLDTELANLESTLDAILVNLALNQRDDGEIRDARVKLHTLEASVLAVLATAGSVPRGTWVTATLYTARDVVINGTSTYLCVVTHTSGTFATDLAAVKWLLLAPGHASSIPFTPTGTLTATDVQAAIVEALADAVSEAVASALAERYVLLQDQKASGTQAGASVAVTWTARVLNTEVSDVNGLCTLAADQFTLVAGDYRIRARAPFLRTDACKLRLRNVTAGTTLLAGSNAYAGSTDINGADSFLAGKFTVAAAQALELQYWTLNTFALNSLGPSATTGEVEVYAEVELWKLS